MKTNKSDFYIFHEQYNKTLLEEKDFCYVCIPQIVEIMNKKYNTNYSEEQIEQYLFGEIQIEDTKLQFENLGI